MPRGVSCSKVLVSVVWCLGLAGCLDSTMPVDRTEFTFVVFDVGQGLSQIGTLHDEAVVWDMGPPGCLGSWFDGYEALGAPYINAIAISHGDLDHVGGLFELPGDIGFSGLVITGSLEDTAAIRRSAANWAGRMRFRTIAQGDTLCLLTDVLIECLWPEPTLIQSQGMDRNQRSLCFRVEHGRTAVLLTGDIDSAVAGELGRFYGPDLRAQVLMVPHHGSRYSLNLMFLGYVRPEVAVISCGVNNQYGHPADEVMQALAYQMGVGVYVTAREGHVLGVSNGEYWVWP